MKLHQLFESTFPTVTLQQAKDKQFFGPVWHGSTEEGQTNIKMQGFVVDDSLRINGYETSSYANGLPAPIHHLGYGVYFTSVKSIAKKFNRDSVKGLVEYYLDVPRIEEINFASPNTMMKWWMTNGYDFSWDNIEGRKDFSNPNVTSERVRATKNMTKQLSSKFDAVWFKGRTIYKALDGDQICVFNPNQKVYLIDNSSVSGFELGAKVKITDIKGAIESYTSFVKQFRSDFVPEVDERDVNFYSVNTLKIPKDSRNVGVIVDIRDNPRIGNKWITIKWKKGGVQHNYTEDMLEIVK